MSLLNEQGELNRIALNATDTGLEVIEVHRHPTFAARRLHSRDVATQMEGMLRLTTAFVECPDTLLQELANAAVDLCGADSSGISIEHEDKTETNFYQWVATAGRYAKFLNAMLPRYPSACGICLERGTPQLFRVKQRFFDLMGVKAPTVTDGLLLPWRVEEMRGTIWILAHGRHEAFDRNDLCMMQVLADFAAMAIRHQRQQSMLVKQSSAAAVAAMANDLAHQINNPLQSLTNVVYLAAEGKTNGDAKSLAQELSSHIQRLSQLARKLLNVADAPASPR